MDAKAFTRRKMQWLNAISQEGELSSTAFRVAYLIGDHINRIAGFAWPSHVRLARKIGLSSKTIHRAVRELERAGWLQVCRLRKQPNHYRLAWPRGKSPPRLDRKAPA